MPPLADAKSSALQATLRAEGEFRREPASEMGSSVASGESPTDLNVLLSFPTLEK